MRLLKLDWNLIFACIKSKMFTKAMPPRRACSSGAETIYYEFLDSSGTIAPNATSGISQTESDSDIRDKLSQV